MEDEKNQKKPKAKVSPVDAAASSGIGFKKAVVNASSASPASKRNLPADISEQFDQTREYVNSPMYRTRLNKMINSERAIQAAASGAGRFNSEILSQHKTGDTNATVIQGVVSKNNKNLDNLSGNISVGDIDLGANVAGGYDSGQNDVRFNEELLRQNRTVPAHEFSHGANDGLQPYSQAFHEKYVAPMMLDYKNSSWQPEVQKPTELKARLDGVRSLAKSLGLYDAGTEKFTPEHLKKLKNNKDIQNDFNFKQIQDQLNGQYKNNGFIWLMNNIAKNNVAAENNNA